MLFLGTLLTKPKLRTKFEDASATVAEISRVSQIFWDAPLVPTPANFGPKRRFLVCYSSNPSYVPSLKFLASTVAAISRGSQFFSMLL